MYLSRPNLLSGLTINCVSLKIKYIPLSASRRGASLWTRLKTPPRCYNARARESPFRVWSSCVCRRAHLPRWLFLPKRRPAFCREPIRISPPSPQHGGETRAQRPCRSSPTRRCTAVEAVADQRRQQPPRPASKRSIGRPQVTKGNKSTPAALKRTRGCSRRKSHPSATPAAAHHRQTSSTLQQLPPHSVRHLVAAELTIQPFTGCHRQTIPAQHLHPVH